MLPFRYGSTTLTNEPVTSHSPRTVLSVVFLASLSAGLLLGVYAMLHGVERPGPSAPNAPPRANVSLPTVAAFAFGFGLVGYLLLRYASANVAGALIGGMAAGGLAVAATVLLIARWAVPSAAADHVDERYLLQGTPARVTRALQGDVDGEVAYEAADGAQYAIPARSFDGSPLEVGDEVIIDRIEGGVAFVEAWAVVEKRI